jgi:hypothetical protein
MIDHRLPAIPIRPWITRAANDVCGLITAPYPIKQRLQLLPLVRINDIIGIQPERIIPGRPRERSVAGRGEVINPHEVKHPRPELAGNLHGPIGRARIDHHDLIEKPADRL